MHTRTYAADKEQIEIINALNRELEDIRARFSINDSTALLSSQRNETAKKDEEMMNISSTEKTSDKKGMEDTSVASNNNSVSASKKEVLSNKVARERIINICCKLDEVDTRGSEPLRNLRRRALQNADSLDQLLNQCSKSITK